MPLKKGDESGHPTTQRKIILKPERKAINQKGELILSREVLTRERGSVI